MDGMYLEPAMAAARCPVLQQSAPPPAKPLYALSDHNVLACILRLGGLNSKP